MEKMLPSTGSRPMVFLCDDINYYACKYGKPNNLFNEYLAGSFCKIFEIPIPDFCFVNVLPEHLPNDASKRDFKFTCFGSYYLNEAMDINNSSITWNSSFIDKITNKSDLLKIGIFDLWLSNEDRNHNNTNLLLNPIRGGNEITVIDHVNIFNTNLLFTTNFMAELSEDESILSTNANLLNLFFKRGVKLNETIENIEESFYICVQECKRNLSEILAEIPNDWGLNVSEKRKIIKENLFSKDWIKLTAKNFRIILETHLKRI